MSDYRVEIKNPIPLVLLIPKSISKVKGVNRYVYPTIEEALALTNQAVIEALDGLPLAKIHCSVLAEEAVKAAIIDFYKKQGKDTSKLEKEYHFDCTTCEHCQETIMS